ncbi:kinesin-like protein KIF18A [Alligator mississippiensis]|uniref:Kinesin-like protein n=1 Tax=Alligator mississippiensis TaxID=8496 RepID=A0A151MBN0_ALLMI|nr:kinesin-like protein KIF18A [Alligator mississippiensis]XP_019332635.1 kinesin-like protein KIF18A [Alligator mississippiensis]KYO21938.1 kinesin-like protein KIF18A [Alligator mississippiensis]
MSASATTEENVCNHVKVVVRVRPENEKEKDGKFSKVVHVVDQHILVFDPKEEVVSFFHGKKILHRDINKRKNKDLKFVFDAVFRENSSQMEVFEHTTKTVLDGFLNGYNCTVLAYGATGAGKTYTMLGSPKDPGVMYLTLMELYNCMDQIKEDKLCTLAVSYFEVYNEQIHDLLVNSGPLAVREDAQRGVLVQGLTLHQPKSAGEILQLLDHGNQNRTQHPTDVNANSSRSHAVFQIYLRQQDKTASISQNVHIAKMSLIDLAGSERASTTNAKGARFREGANINRSLLALGNVINALADPKSKKQHIPYRNSKLTRLLKDSLGGNCRTIMIAAVSPSSMFYDDTYNTLKYANRSKDIKSSLKSNVVSLDSHMSQYAKICDEQKKEILMLKEKLRAFEERAAVPENCGSSSLSNQQQVEIQRFQEILKSLFVNREEIRKEHLKLEMQLKENAVKTYYQKQCHEQIQLMCSEERIEKATCKRDHRLSMLKTRCLHVQKKKENMMKQFEENNNWLHRVENEMRLLSQDGHIPQELRKDLHYCHLKLEVKDLKTQINHMLTLVSLQEQHHKQTEKVLNTLLPVLRRQYLVLKEAGLANDIIEANFKEVEQVIQRPKTVVWADQTMEKEPKQNDQPTMSVIIAFPQLTNNSNTPCRTSPEVKNNVQLATECVGPLQKRTRRKLMDSPTTSQSPKASQQSSLNQLEDSLSKEVRPIVYTPEACRKLEQNPCTWTIVKQSLQVPGARKKTTCNAEDVSVPLKRVCNMNSTFHVSECEEVDMNSTVTLYRGTTEINDASTMLSEKESQSCSNSSVLQRLGLPSLLNRNPGPIHEKPSYMAMTSAAERKRKLLSSTSNTGLSSQQEPVSAKRIRQDILLSHKPLRVLKTAALRKKSQKQEQDVQRNLVRSLSEGNVALGVKSRTSKKLLIQVCKKK